jgi:hypothetical protein
MEKTGERYAAARASLLAAEEPKATETPTLTVSDEVIRRRTGRGWEEWFDLLDDSGAIARPHGEIARWLQSEHDIDGWSAQSVTVSYERAGGRRAVGERADGFAITASKKRRGSGRPPIRRVRPRVAARALGFTAKGDAKSVVDIEHARHRDAAEAERMKAFWREQVAALKEVLEG